MLNASATNQSSSDSNDLNSQADEPTKAKVKPVSLQDRLNDEQKEKYENIKKGLRAADATDIKQRFNVAMNVRDLMESTDKYGRRVVALPAHDVGRTPQLLYGYADVARAWSQGDLGKMVSDAAREKWSLTFSHLVILAKVSDATTRRALFAEAAKGRLSVRDARRLVNGAIGQRANAHLPSAAEEARRFCRELAAVVKRGSDMLAALDAKWDDSVALDDGDIADMNSVAAEVRELAARVEARTSRRPVVCAPEPAAAE
jgi:hypothetical protein